MDKFKIDNIDFGDVHEWDRPDFTDAYIESADYKGEPMTEQQLDEINEDVCFIHEELNKN